MNLCGSVKMYLGRAKGQLEVAHSLHHVDQADLRLKILLPFPSVLGLRACPTMSGGPQPHPLESGFLFINLADVAPVLNSQQPCLSLSVMGL